MQELFCTCTNMVTLGGGIHHTFLARRCFIISSWHNLALRVVFHLLGSEFIKVIWWIFCSLIFPIVPVHFLLCTIRHVLDIPWGGMVPPTDRGWWGLVGEQFLDNKRPHSLLDFGYLGDTTSDELGNLLSHQGVYRFSHASELDRKEKGIGARVINRRYLGDTCPHEVTCSLVRYTVGNAVKREQAMTWLTMSNSQIFKKFVQI